MGETLLLDQVGALGGVVVRWPAKLQCTVIPIYVVFNIFPSLFHRVHQGSFSVIQVQAFR